jgi:hypothetical protein
MRLAIKQIIAPSRILLEYDEKLLFELLSI